MPGSISTEYHKWLNKYEKLSGQTCIICGEPGKLTAKGWLMPLCKDCEEKGWK